MGLDWTGLDWTGLHGIGWMAWDGMGRKKYIQFV
jgi:hypothetical protein